MKRRVVVTGLGAVTSLSSEVNDLWKRLLEGESGVHALRAFDTTQHKVKFGGDFCRRTFTNDKLKTGFPSSQLEIGLHKGQRSLGQMLPVFHLGKVGRCHRVGQVT